MAPFLALMGDPDVDNLSREQAHKLREMCLMDYKQRLVHSAEIIHARFEKVVHLILNWRGRLNALR